MQALLIIPGRTSRGQLPPPTSRRRWAAGFLLVCVVALVAVSHAVARDPFIVSRAARSLALRTRGVEILGADDVVLQRTASDCGPAAVSNLFIALGRPDPGLDTLSILAGLTPRGTTIGGLATAAKAFGLRLEPVRIEPPSTHGIRLPFIAWIERSHFVVVTGRSSSGHIEVIDPQVGRLRMDERDFTGNWSGEALVLVEDPSAGG